MSRGNDKAPGLRRAGIGTGGAINIGKDFPDDSTQLTRDVKSGSRSSSQHLYTGYKETNFLF